MCGFINKYNTLSFFHKYIYYKTIVDFKNCANLLKTMTTYVNDDFCET